MLRDGKPSQGFAYGVSTALSFCVYPQIPYLAAQPSLYSCRHPQHTARVCLRSRQSYALAEQQPTAFRDSNL